MSTLSIDSNYDSLTLFNSTSKLQDFFGVNDIQELKTEISNNSGSMTLFNSTSKLQDFFGVNDIQEIKTEINNRHKKRNSNSNHAHNTNNNDRTKKLKRESKKLQRGLDKLRKERKNASKQRTSSKWLKPAPLSLMMMDIDVNMNSNEKCLWRPSLETIFKDDVLLNSLIKFMQKSYNEENILFLQAVKTLNNHHKNINDIIINIYDLYIVSGSQYQINLSYDCFMNVLSKRHTLNTLNLNEKIHIFDLCVDEIEKLILSSVLSSFYNSNQFQSMAQKSKYYQYRVASYYSEYMSSWAPPIKLNLSCSTESFFECHDE